VLFQLLMFVRMVGAQRMFFSPGAGGYMSTRLYSGVSHQHVARVTASFLHAVARTGSPSRHTRFPAKLAVASEAARTYTTRSTRLLHSSMTVPSTPFVLEYKSYSQKLFVP
jgi:hypothetical protein